MITQAKNNDIRVLVLHGSLAPYRLPLFQALANSPGYTFDFLFSNRVSANRDWEFGDDLGINYKILDAKRIKVGNRSLNVWLDVKGIACKYDLVVLNDHLNIPEIVLQAYAKVMKVPVLRWFATTNVSLQELSPTSIRLKAFINKLSDSILVPGNEARDYAIETTNRSDNVYICNNVVDNDLFAKARDVSSEKVKSFKDKNGLKGPVLSYFGQFIARKGFDVMLEAFKKLNPDLEFSLLLVGDGPLRSEIQNSLSNSRNCHLHITGYIDPQELPFYYAVSDATVLPSHIDTWGMVVNEAMAAGIPVICSTGAGAYRDMVQHGKSGMVFEKGDSSALASAIEAVLSDAELRQSFVKEADKILEEFTIEAARDQFLEAIKKTCNIDKH